MMLTKHIFGKLTRIFVRDDNGKVIDDEEVVLDGVVVKKEKEQNAARQENQDGGVFSENKGVVSDLDTIHAFCSHLEASGLAHRTVIEYKADLKIWASLAAKDNLSLRDLKIENVEKFLKKKDPDTARRKIASLRTFARWRLRENESGVFIELQKLGYKARKIRVPKALDFDGFKTLIKNVKSPAENGDRCALWLSLMCLCGLRISEIRTATADMRAGYLRVIGKGNKERLVSCPQWLLDSLKKVKKENYQKSRQYIDLQLRKLGHQKFHRFRHTYATKLLSEKIPIEKIKDSLGHSSISTTQVYLKTEILENAHEFIEK